jgi:hypothetical protein
MKNVSGLTGGLAAQKPETLSLLRDISWLRSV